MNRLIEDLGAISSKAPAYPYAGAAVTAIRNKAEAQNSGDFSLLWCGQNANTCKEIAAAKLTKELAADFF